MKFSNLFITVGTPIVGKGPDLGYLNNTIDLILKHSEHGAKVFLRITVPVGTTSIFAKKIHKTRPDISVGFCQKDL